MKIIVGLGNPDKKYENTRHNVGFMAIDYLVKKLGGEWKENKKWNALIYKDLNNIFVKPLTFMNNSGVSVSKIISYFNLIPKKLNFIKEKNADLKDSLTIIHDELDILLGEFKEKTNSSSGGHNGVKSIINRLKTKNFKRIKIGISTEERTKIPTEKFVLCRFNKKEKEVVENLIKRIKI